jgi:hypothetical protein
VGAGPPAGPDPGLEVLFGSAAELEREGARALRRSAWTRGLLERELRAAGFDPVSVESTAEGRLRARATHGPARAVDAPRGPLPESNAARAAAGRPDARTAGERPPGDGRRRFFAWPDYGDPVGLERFLADYAAPLVDRGDCVLVLGFDPDRDGPRAGVVEALGAAHARALGSRSRLDVTLLDEPLDEEGWRTVGRHLEARIALPTDVHWPAPLVMDCPTLVGPAALAAAVVAPPPATSTTGAATTGAPTTAAPTTREG